MDNPNFVRFRFEQDKVIDEKYINRYAVYFAKETPLRETTMVENFYNWQDKGGYSENDEYFDHVITFVTYSLEDALELCEKSWADWVRSGRVIVVTYLKNLMRNIRYGDIIKNNDTGEWWLFLPDGQGNRGEKKNWLIL